MRIVLAGKVRVKPDMRLIIILLSMLHGSVLAENWQTYRAQGELVVEYRQQAGLLQIRSQVQAVSGVGAFLHLLEDTANITRWAANSEKAELLEHADAHTDVVHTYFNAPWPVAKRDAVTRSVWSQHASNGAVTLQVTDLGQQFPAVPGYVRMQQVQGQWTLTPLPGGQLRIQYQGQADAGGKLPQFISNKVALRATYQTFLQLPEILLHYQTAYPGIVEP
jgi:hypothetical protein